MAPLESPTGDALQDAYEHFDDVIVGGGSAGCVFANRLSADAMRRVLVEAGVDMPPSLIPPEISDSYPMALFFGDRYIWPGLKATMLRSQDGQPQRRVYEQGRVMG